VSEERTSRWGAVFSTIVAVAIVVSCGCGSSGTSRMEHITQDGVLTVGNDTTYAPFEFVDSSNAPTGFDVDLISAVAAKLGLKAQIVTTAWDGIIPALQSDKFEAVISAMTITPDREKEVLFSTPYYRSDMGIVFDRTLHAISRPDDLAGLRVGVQIGTTGESSARLISGLTDIRAYPDIQLAMTDLDLGRIDAVVNDYPVCAYYARDSAVLSVVRVITINQTNLTQYYGIALKRGDAELKAAIDRALTDLVSDGTYDSLYTKWFGEMPEFRPGDNGS